jgi:uncharacterized membrane protein YgcG
VPTSEGFSAAQRRDIDRAIRAAETTSRFEFSVFVGHAEGDPRRFAEQLHGALASPSRTVLVMVDPSRRVLQVVTGDVVGRQLTDDSVRLAVIAMQSAFAEGDLVGGLQRGLAQLAEASRAPQTLHAD